MKDLVEDVSPRGPVPWLECALPVGSLSVSLSLSLSLSLSFSQTQYLTSASPFKVPSPPASSSAQAEALSPGSPRFSVHLPSLPATLHSRAPLSPIWGQFPHSHLPNIQQQTSPPRRDAGTTSRPKLKPQQLLLLLPSLHPLNTPRYLTFWIVLESASHPCSHLVSRHLLLEYFQTSK